MSQLVYNLLNDLTSPDNYTANTNRIVCRGLVGFTFRNISHVILCGLTYNSCGKRLNVCRYDPVTANYTTHLTTYGVWVNAGQDTKIFNCSFQDSVGTSLGVFNSGLDLSGAILSQTTVRFALAEIILVYAWGEECTRTLARWYSLTTSLS